MSLKTIAFAGMMIVTAATGWAQETGTPAPDEGLALGEVVELGPQIGQPYTKETHGDWLLRCIKLEEGPEPCEMTQLIRGADGNPVAEMSIFKLPNGGQAVAGANLVTPLETLLTAQLTLRVDENEPRAYPFAFCARVGCISRIGLTSEEVVTYQKGNKAQMIIVPAGAPNEPIVLEISLTGFTAAFRETTIRQ